MRLVILGGPGSGKGTQGKQLCNKLGIPWISTGDIFRAAIAHGSELGIQAAPYVERGELVPDPIAIELIRERLMQSDTENGWLLDGYPRTAFQAEELDFLLDNLGKRLNWAIWLDVPEPILIDRSLGRSREDDRPDIIRRRIELFHERTIPIMEYYDPRGRLLKIDGNQPPDEVHQNIITALKPGKTSWQRPDGRPYDRLRPVTFEKNFTRFATSSVLTRCGDTQVLCTATIQPGVPPFLRDSGQGWLTAEYRMLPSATPERQTRELLKLSGRTQEIQRLIGRSLRAALDFQALGERTITIDADVLQADAGTRTASITGGYVALADALEKLVNSGELDRSPIRTPVAAISVGLIGGEPFLDLNYPEDVAAQVDFNVVMNGELEAIELQGTAEEGSFSRHQLNQLLDLAEGGIRELLELQRQVLGIGNG